MIPSDIDASSYSWSNLTAADIRDVGSQNGSLLILPIGSLEQHGPHLPVSTDTLLVNDVAELGAERVSGDIPVLVLPPFWAGYSPHHLSFGGTISLEFEHMLHVIENIAETGLENGYDSLLLLNGHGGNISIINTLTSEIGRDHDDVEVLGLTYFQLASEFIDDVRESDVGGMGHGGEFETSLMLHLHEELVREEEFEGVPMDEPYNLSISDMFEGGPLAVYRGFDEYTDTGTIGNPEDASAETGKQIYTRLGDVFESLLRDIHKRNTE